MLWGKANKSAMIVWAEVYQSFMSICMCPVTSTEYMGGPFDININALFC